MSELSLKKRLPVSPEIVFDAWTTPEHMSHWLSPMSTASIPKLDLRVGGEFQSTCTARERITCTPANT